MTTEMIKLKSGYDMPVIGIGTWQLKDGEGKAAVKAAVGCGYRLLDCAYIYGNEALVGEALSEVFKEGSARREDLFIISKLWNTRHHPDEVKSSLQESLDRLQVKYIDLYLIHWPMAFKRGGELFPRGEDGELIYDDIHYFEAWKMLEQCVDEGLIRSIGLSNFNSQQIQYVIDHARIKPAALEIEIYPYFNQHQLVDFCRERDIAVIAHSSFGSPNRPWAASEKSVLEDECIVSIASRLGKTPAQIVLRWLYQRRIASIPKSVTPARIQQNMQIFDFELSSADFEAVNKLNKDLRIGAPTIVRNGVLEYRDKDAPYFPLHVEF